METTSRPSTRRGRKRTGPPDYELKEFSLETGGELPLTLLLGRSRLKFAPELSNHKRTPRRRLAAPSAAPEAATAAETAEDTTRRIFPECFAEGYSWLSEPEPAAAPTEPAVPARFPYSYLVLPPSEQVNAPCGELESVAEEITKLIEDAGAVNIPPDLLLRAVGNLYEMASNEAHQLYQEQLDGRAPPWLALFHDDAADGNHIRAGDKKKTMSPPLGSDSTIVQLFNKSLTVLAPGHKVARDPDGKWHIVLIHHDGAQLFSGEDYGQAEHDEMPIYGHDCSNHFSNRTLQACLRPDGPRVLWILFGETPTGVYLHKRSHHVVRMANQVFVHYAPLWAEYKRTHSCSTEEDFKRIWAVFVLRHVKEECKRLGIQVEPEAILNTVQPGGALMWHSLLGHGGTSQEGLRAFAIVQNDEDQGTVVLPQKTIELFAQSRVLAGVLAGVDGALKPLDVALANGYAAEQLCKMIKLPHDACRLRADTTAVQAALLRVLDGVRSNWGVRLIPAHAPDDKQKPLTVTFANSRAFFGLVCSLQGQGRPGDGICKVVLWVEYNSGAQDLTRATLVRNAAFTLALNRLQDRRALILKTVTNFVPVSLREPVATYQFQDFSFLCSAVVMGGEMLSVCLERDLWPWKQSRELGEKYQKTSSSLFQTVDRLEDDGFRFVKFGKNLFYVTGDGRVILMFSGGGFLGPKKRPQCDRMQNRGQGALPMLRRNTSHYCPEFILSGKVRADCNLNMKRLRQLARAQQAEASAAAAERDSDDVDPALKQWTDSDLRNWLGSHSGKGMGVFGREGDPSDLMMFDQGLIDDLGSSRRDRDSVMDLLRLTDVHQMMTGLVCDLREVSKPEEPFSERRKMLAAVFDQPTLEQSFAGMADFLYGRSPDKPATRRETAHCMICNQPAAFQRLLELFVFSLHAAYRERAVQGISNMLFPLTVLFSPGDELLLSQGDGLRVEVPLYPFDDDPDFKKSVDKMLKQKRAKGLEKFPRTVFLKNEGEFGVGVHSGPGEYKQGEFCGFYYGIEGDMDAEPSGRYVVTSTGQDAKYCDGFGIPASEHRRRGTFGSFMNSSWFRRDAEGKSLRPNVTLDQKSLIRKTCEGRKIVCIPIFALRDFSNEFFNWDYDPGAGHGCSLN